MTMDSIIYFLVRDKKDIIFFQLRIESVVIGIQLAMCPISKLLTR